MYEPERFAPKLGRGTATGPVRTRGICSSNLPLSPVPVHPGAVALSSAASLAFAAARLVGSGETDLQQTNALVWTMVAMSAAGAIITFAFLVYSLWKFRDPKVKNRRHG